MSKKKTKLSLIDDYIKIVLINNFCSVDFKNFNLDDTLIASINNIKNDNIIWKHLYERLFDVMRLKDVSFLVLERDLLLYENRNITSAHDIIRVYNMIENELECIKNNFTKKIKLLKCEPFSLIL